MKELALNKGYVALVDDEDYERVAAYRWYVAAPYGKVTAVYRSLPREKGKPRKSMYLHRFILDFPKNHVDHRNRNPLDNRRDNLRVCLQAENNRNVGRRRDNTSGYKGVWYYKKVNRWAAVLYADKKRHFLGYFANPVDAARAYNKAAVERHGAFACLNEVPDGV